MKKIAICWITGAVWQEILTVLEKLNFPVSELNLFASARSAWKIQKTYLWEIEIQEFSVEKTQENDFIFVCVSWDFSKQYAKELTRKWAIVIDNSSAFRYDPEIPLVVPEINPEEAKKSKLIANPNCTTAILSVALYPIYKEFWLKKVIVSTYQATSGGWAPAMKELEDQTRNHLNWEEVTCDKFAHPIPFNLIPQIDKFQENLYTKEEMKVTWETRKIFGQEDLKLSCTAVRIPTFRAHAESVTVETEKEVDLEKIRELIKNAPWVDLVDSPEKLEYPMPISSTEKFNVEAGRFRKNEVFDNHWLDFFVCWDQLLKWAALNAVQIAKLFV